MVAIEEHQKTVQQLETDLKEKIQLGLLAQRQKIVGFACSEAATNMFAILLHSKRLVSEGFNVNHNFFSSRKIAEERIPFSFPRRGEIISRMVEMEALRERLCYGKEKSESEVIKAVELFFDIKKLVESIIGEAI